MTETGNENIRRIEEIKAGKTALGIEFGSTRIKAVLIGPDHSPIASGSHGWENRLENGLVIVARTDARTVVGLDEAIRRGRLYLDAGADVIFVESPESYEEVKKIASEIKGPVLFNNVEGGRSPFLSRQELAEAGVKMTIYPNAQTRVVAKKCMELLNTLQQTGTTAGMENEMLSHRELWSMFNSEKWVAIEKKYMPD